MAWVRVASLATLTPGSVTEAVFAALLAIAALYTGFNEGLANWQSLLTCAVYFLLGITLWQARGVQSPK